jgi:GxxExxY protein
MPNGYQVKNKIDLVYPELSYKIIGILYDIFNTLGHGHKENYYQKAISAALYELNINFEEQVYYPMKYKDTIIGKYFFDFLIDNKIILEIKANDRFSRKNIEQTYSYLKAGGLKLGILANFTNNKVVFKRIVNLL